MRFLADESCDFSVVRALRAADHDVIAIAELSPREEDSSVMDRAVKDTRILITEDKDFGQLVYARKANYRRSYFSFVSQRVYGGSQPAAVVELVRRCGESLIGNFTVVQPGRARTGRKPRK